MKVQNVCLILLSFSFVGLVISCQPQDNAQYVARATVTSESGHAEGDLDLFPFLTHQEALKYRGWEGWPDSAWSVTLSEGLDLHFQKPYAFHMNRDTLVVEEFVGEYIQGQDFWLEVDPYRYDSTWITFMVEETVHENFDFHQVPKSEESHDTKTLRERYEAFELSAFRWRGWSHPVLLADSAHHYRIDTQNAWGGYWEQKRKALMGWRDTTVDFSGEADNFATINVDGKPCTHWMHRGILAVHALEPLNSTRPPQIFYVQVIFSYGC